LHEQKVTRLTLTSRIHGAILVHPRPCRQH
jgi:hypothetical protein